MLDSHFVLLGAAFSLMGIITAVVRTLQGKASPNRVTWLLWALSPLIAFSAELGEHVGLQALMTFMSGFGPLMVFISSLLSRKYYWKLARFDYSCAALAVAAIVLWQVTGSGNLAIVFSIVADGFAAIPTVFKAYKYPGTENARVFLFAAINAAITLLTVKRWTFAYGVFPVYVLTTCLILFALIKIPRLRPDKLRGARSQQSKSKAI